MRCQLKKKPVFLAVVAFLLSPLLVTVFITTQAAAGSGGNPCIKEEIGGNPPCTANDVRFSALDVISGPTSCILGEIVTLEVEATLESGPERYDIGLWINEDGGSALSDPDGTCYRDYLHPVSVDNSDCNQDGGPFYNAPGEDDNCGDVPAVGSDPCGSVTGDCSVDGGTCLFTYHTFTIDVLCIDGNYNGVVDTGWATSWDNNVGNFCDGELDTDPGTGSKCYATDYADLDGIVVCTDGDGDGFSPDGGECGPVDCDDADPDVNPGAEELCNGIDDNCDGNTDEGFDVGMPCTAGIGICLAQGTYVCTVDGLGSECDAVPGTPEVEGPCCGGTCFDNLDNDCDGLTDKFSDPDCSLLQCSIPPSPEAPVVGPDAIMQSGPWAQVGFFLIPLAQIFLMRRFFRRKS